MSNSIPAIEAIERAEKRHELPMFRAGDTIRVHALISEGNKERIQVFEGVCIHRKRGGGRGSFTVRKVSSSHGVGVERVWPDNSPRVTKVELVTRGKVRRAKLYYLRELRGNAARITSKLGNYGAILARQSEKQAQAKTDQAESAIAAAADAKAAADKAAAAKAAKASQD